MNYGNCLFESKWNINIVKVKERGGNEDSVQVGEIVSSSTVQL